MPETGAQSGRGTHCFDAFSANFSGNGPVISSGGSDVSVAAGRDIQGIGAFYKTQTGPLQLTREATALYLFAK